MRQLFALYTCDTWKSPYSMRMIGVFTISQLPKIMKKKVKQEQIEFQGDFKKIKEMSPHDINTALEYGFVERIIVNEEMR